MKWILRHILNDDIRLSPEQLDAVRLRVSEYAARERLAWMRNILPGVVTVIAIQFWPQLRQTFSLGWYVAFEVTFSLTMLAIVFWLLKRTYARYAYRAVHELGLANICPRCGYDHTGLGEYELKCPECGAERHQNLEREHEH
jgi:hypothetical protein